MIADDCYSAVVFKASEAYTWLPHSCPVTWLELRFLFGRFVWSNKLVVCTFGCEIKATTIYRCNCNKSIQTFIKNAAFIFSWFLIGWCPELNLKQLVWNNQNLCLRCQCYFLLFSPGSCSYLYYVYVWLKEFNL